MLGCLLTHKKYASQTLKLPNANKHELVCWILPSMLSEFKKEPGFNCRGAVSTEEMRSALKGHSTEMAQVVLKRSWS